MENQLTAITNVENGNRDVFCVFLTLALSAAGLWNGRVVAIGIL